MAESGLLTALLAADVESSNLYHIAKSFLQRTLGMPVRPNL